MPAAETRGATDIASVQAMLNTKCPDCYARFYVSEDLVAGKIVRFRCRKCSGTITVDGIGGEGATTGAASDGPDGGLVSRIPPAPNKVGASSAPKQEDSAKRSSLHAAAGSATPAPSGRRQSEGEAPAEEDADTRAAMAPPARVPPCSAKPVDQEGEPTTLFQKGGQQPTGTEQGGEPTVLRQQAPAGAEPAPKPVGVPVTPKASAVRSRTVRRPSKAQLSRVSMQVASVFELPPNDEHEVDFNEEPAFEEGVAKRSANQARDTAPGATRQSEVMRARSPESVDPSEEEVELESIRPPPLRRKAPPAPTGKGPPAPTGKVQPARGRAAPTPVGRAMRRDSSPIDLAAALVAAPRLPSYPDAEQPDLPWAIPTARPRDRSAPVSATSSAQPDVGALRAHSRPAPAAARESEQGFTRKRGLWAAVAAALVLLGGGAYALRGAGAPSAFKVPARTAMDEPPEAAPVAEAQPGPVAEQLAAPPGAPREAEPVATAVPEATATAAATRKPAGKRAAAELKPGGALQDQPEAPSPLSTPAPTAVEPASPPTRTAAQPKPADTPKPPQPPKAPESTDAPFNKGAAAASIGALKGAAQGCKQEGGPQGHASVAITFAPTGRVTTALVSGPPFAGTSAGGCIASTFRRATVPPFAGPPVTVRTSVAIF
jgi:predicted Zn finger-like uncharacterized protein